jgi:hypothetical protein
MKLILADLQNSEEHVTTISENSSVKISGEDSAEHSWRNRSWVVPVAVTVSIFGALLVVAGVVLVAHSRGALGSGKYTERV